jgi:hypothetical protein
LRSIVCHAIARAFEIILEGEVAMMALVESLGAEEVSRWAGSCDRAFAIPVETDNIIGAGFDGALANIVTVCCYRVVQDTASQFELRVVNSAGWVCRRDQPVLDGGVEWDAPEQGCVGVDGVLDKGTLTQRVDFHVTGNGLRRWEPYAPSAPTGSIVGTQQGGLHGDQLLEARRVIAHAVGEPPEFSDGIVKTFV